MKKFMLLTTVVGLALTSCVNDTEVAPSPNRPLVSFDSPVMRSTRANHKGEIQGTTYPTSEYFTVFCKLHAGDYQGWNSDSNSDYFQANGDVAKHDGNSTSYWVTDKTYYWPDAGYKLSFAAYSPAELGDGVEVTRTETGFSIKNFKVSATSDEHYDLMYTGTVANSVYNGQAVPLQFRHAMSSIVFSSSKENEDVKYEITDLKLLGNLYTEGDFSQKLVEDFSAGYTETESPSWDFGVRSKAAVSYEPTFTPFDVPASAPMIFTENKSAILPIPQEIDESVIVNISYTKTVNGSTKTNHTADIKLIDFVDVNDGTTVTKKWEVGKRYIYRIEFGQNKRIYFNPSVTPWETGGTYRYTIS